MAPVTGSAIASDADRTRARSIPRTSARDHFGSSSLSVVHAVLSEMNRRELICCDGHAEAATEFHLVHGSVEDAHWLDTIAWQNSGKEVDRGVKILDKKAGATIENLPFLHIERIRSRCIGTGGGLRKAVRLCKNVKEDSERQIYLPSFDIAATMYHADMSALRNGLVFELAILSETQRHLDFLAVNQAHAKTLLVPDGSRAIFDTDEKWQGLLRLSSEMDDLLSNVFAENAPGFLGYGRSMSQKRGAVASISA